MWTDKHWPCRKKALSPFSPNDHQQAERPVINNHPSIDAKRNKWYVIQELIKILPKTRSKWNRKAKTDGSFAAKDK
jgi:hypothetical protein